MWHLQRTVMCLMAGLASGASGAAVPLPRSVLILEQNNPNAPAYVDFASHFQATLNANDASPVDVYIESFDLYRFDSAEYRELLRDYLTKKYRSKPIGVIVPVGPLALEFELSSRAVLWPTAPIAFEGIDTESLSGLHLPPDTTGDTENLTLWDEVNAAKIMVPNLRRVAIVGDPLERQSTYRHFAKEMPQIAAELQIIDLTGLPMTEVQRRTAELPPDLAIIYIGIHVDGAGKSYTARDGLVPIAEVANRPIVITTETYFGYGATGGVMTSYGRMGDAAGQLVLRILSGESASKIAVAKSLSTKLRFDSRQLQRWGISEFDSPPGSEVSFREPTAWERYHWQIISIATALLMQTMLIFGLLFEHRRRRSAEASSTAAISRLADLNRVATAGELTASIAHEIRQPLATMVTSANAALRWLMRKTPDLDEARAAMNGVVSAGHRANEVIESIRAMFRKDGQTKEPINLNNLIKEVLGFVRRELQTQEVLIQTELTEPLPSVRGHNGQLQQVILNVVRNAAEAMDSTSNRARILRVKTAIHDRAGVLLSIEDSGTGVDPNQLNRIFESFFTSKSEGMGIGLSICRSIVEAHGGRIWATSDGRHGSVFNILLPMIKPGTEM